MEDCCLKDLLNYIEFLRSKGYFVSLSGFDNRFAPYTAELSNYEVHLHPICFYLKQNKSTLGRCQQNKRRLNSAEITEPFYSCCYAGVEEYVVPVLYEGKRIMLINVSGYRGALKKSARFMSRLSAMCDSEFPRLYEELSVSPPALAEILSFAKPLEYMIIKLYELCKEHQELNIAPSPAQRIFKDACEYIELNYMYPLSCEDLARELNYSVSYLQLIFKQEGGTTVKAYINSVRLSKARYLLLHSTIKIIDVAFSCGFSDSNYFSSAFKRKFGISPKRLRKSF